MTPRGNKTGRRTSRLGGQRSLQVQVRSLAGRKNSSSRWLQRQLNDPFVREARRQGYRSRAAFKLIELDERCGLFRPGFKVVDLGAAPGGWSQVAVAAVKSGESLGSETESPRVLAVDLLPIEPIAGVTCLCLDFREPSALTEILRHLGAPVDVVISDLAPSTTGHRQTDHLRLMGLAEAAHACAVALLRPGGHFVVKILRGGQEQSFFNDLKKDFQEVRQIKPQSSRADSSEIYFVARAFQGRERRATAQPEAQERAEPSRFDPLDESR